jgi:hypothetical protein
MKARLEWARRPLSSRRILNTEVLPLVDDEVLDLVTVAFNNPQLLAEQHRLLEKNVLDPFVWTIADNSSDDHARAEIRLYCLEHHLPLIDLPRSPYTGRNPSRSHGESLNYVYRRYLQPRKAKYIGLLDHDVFPVAPTRIIPELVQSQVFGRVVHQNGAWYIWPGLAFFGRSILDRHRVDFNPCPGLDTGGSNFELLYRELNVATIDRMGHRIDRVFDQEHGFWNYEVLGSWIHTQNGSAWRPNDMATSSVLSLLQNY